MNRLKHILRTSPGHPSPKNTIISLALCAALLTSCATSKQTAESRGTGMDALYDFIESKNANAICLLDPNEGESEELPSVESEQSIAQELEGLRNVGSWDEGQAAELTAIGESEYDFPVVLNRQVQYYLDLFQNEQRKTFATWLGRSSRYLPMITEELQKAGLPLDLTYLPMIESGFKLNAYSRAKAVGPWQFINSTGRNYGLKIDNYVDERRDPVKSTRAAIAYLSNLYSEFQSWHLAVAAYNAGEGKIRRAIDMYQTDNFWKIAQHDYLKLETKRYVPKLIAAIIIAKNPGKYGFTDICYEEPLNYETIEVPRWTTIDAVATAANIPKKTLIRLNSELLRGMAPPGRRTYTMKIPAETHAIVARNLPRVQPLVATKFKDHVVQKGDTIASVCRKYNLNKTTLLKANNLRSSKLFAGQRLRIPYRTTTYELLAAASDRDRYGAASTSPENLILHKVQRGETVIGIASRYNVTPHHVAGWNDLADLHQIRAGQQLALYLAPANDRVLHPVKAKSKPGMGQGTASSGPPAQKTSVAPQHTYYQVKNGDTLWAISRKFNKTPEEIKTWNNLDGDTIHPGLRLVIRQARDIDA